MAPLVMPLSLPVIPIMMGALFAYDGLDRRMLGYATLLLVGIELLGGLDFGVFSLAFLMTALLLAAAGRIMEVSPWSDAEGWHISDLVRTTLTAMVAAAIMIVGSVFVAAFGYGLGMPWQRISLALAPEILLRGAVAAFIAIVVLRRIDMPFRQRIRFGN